MNTELCSEAEADTRLRSGVETDIGLKNGSDRQRLIPANSEIQGNPKEYFNNPGQGRAVIIRNGVRSRCIDLSSATLVKMIHSIVCL